MVFWTDIGSIVWCPVIYNVMVNDRRIGKLVDWVDITNCEDWSTQDLDI